MITLRVTKQQAAAALARVPHATFQRAIDRHWHVSAIGVVDGRSACWLFCWAKTGISSRAAASEAERVFDEVLSVPYTVFDARVNHAWARVNRSVNRNIDRELTSLLTDRT